MNVNGSRFHLLFGPNDWGRCLSAADDGKTLGKLWITHPEDPASKRPSLDEDKTRLRLAKNIEKIPDTPGERRFTFADHRPAAADRNGNLYWIADDQLTLLVQSAGDQAVNLFWPRGKRSAMRQAFVDYEGTAGEPGIMRAVAVTADDYLIASAELANGDELLRFDLVGGGAPERFVLPEGVRVDDLAPACGGGAWLLDRAAQQVLHVDRDMRLATRPIDGVTPAFAPDGEEPSPCSRTEPEAISTAVAAKPTALAALPDGSLLLLDVPVKALGRIFILEPGASAFVLLRNLECEAFCLAIDTCGETPVLMVGDAGGNRAWRVKLDRANEHWTAGADFATLPLRRFGGRALVPIRGVVHYDSGQEPLWVRVMELPHRAFGVEASFLTPIYDSGEPQCLWDRLRLDACIPGGTSIMIEARSADDKALLEGSLKVDWALQPQLHLSPAPSELEGMLPKAAPRPDPKAGKGCWETLLQGITGRYCQLRVKLRGDGSISPHIRALRLWYPRFSYVERFLPAIYRSEAPPGSFLDRFLANFEGIATALEDRIAGAETLFDPRTVPSDLLDWLAGWFDVAIDARWDDARRRLFLANAAQFFGWRGTIRGLQLSLKLALAEQINESDFKLDGPETLRPGGIRIVESFRRMPNLRRFGPSIENAPPLGKQALDLPWSPQEGSRGLWARWQAAGGEVPSGSVPFPLYADFEGWTEFCQAQFGFVPRVGARERERWQAFQHTSGIEAPAGVASGPMPGPSGAKWRSYIGLNSHERRLWQKFLGLRYRTVDRLGAAWAVNWEDFSDIPLPDQLPQSEAAVRDWLIFEGQRLPMEAGAHRFSVLLPRARVDVPLEAEADLLARARRVVELEKPAHTRFDIRFYWAMNRIGEARLGLDTSIGQGSRAPELVPSAIVGRTYVGAAFVGGAETLPRGRSRIAC